jgi:hypothetical protein
MSIWNKILLGLIGVGALAQCYLTVRMLKTQQYWEWEVATYQKALNDKRKENQKLVEAEKLDNGNLGTRHARLELEKALLGRGRVWHDCMPLLVALDRQTGNVAVNVEQPDPHEIKVNMVLYVMSQAEKGGYYVGEFRVVAVHDKKVQLAPTEKLDEEEIARVAKSDVGGKGWVMYEIMPVDKHILFADLKPDELSAFKAALPAASLDEYLRDGTPAEAGDAAKRVHHGKYARRLRDYTSSFAHFRTERAKFDDLCEAAERNRKYLQSASDDAKQQMQFQEKVRDELKTDKTAVAREVEVVRQHLAALQEKLTALVYDVKRRLEANVALAKEIVREQLDAARRIDERTAHELAREK